VTTTLRGTIRGMAARANPGFAVGVVLVPLVALVYAVTGATVQHHTYVHVMAGTLWTGIDLFMALVLGPVLGGLAVEERASVFERFTPKMTFLMPTLAIVTIAAGIALAFRVVPFPHAGAWIALFSAAATLPPLALISWQFDAFGDRRWQAAFAIALLGNGAYLATALPEFGMTSHALAATFGIVTVLAVIGFGLLLPGEVRIYLEMVSHDPDPNVISTVGMRNARLAGVQGAFQLAVILVMVYLRWL